jgi:hypothetical protein
MMRWASLVVVVVLAAGFSACQRAGARASDAAGAERRLPPTVPAAVATVKEMINELSVQPNFKNHTWGPFEVRRGVRVPIEGFWQRYAPFVGIPISELVLVRPPRPAPVIPNAKLYDFQQVHAGYPVANYGYSLEVLDGYVLSGLGKAMTGLPDRLPTPITPERAMEIALEQVEPKGARPWLTEPGRWQRPASGLALSTGKVDPIGADFRLLYTFSFSSTGVHEPGSLIIDAEAGTVIARTSARIR